MQFACNRVGAQRSASLSPSLSVCSQQWPFSGHSCTPAPPLPLQPWLLLCLPPLLSPSPTPSCLCVCVCCADGAHDVQLNYKSAVARVEKDEGGEGRRARRRASRRRVWTCAMLSPSCVYLCVCMCVCVCLCVYLCSSAHVVGFGSLLISFVHRTSPAPVPRPLPFSVSVSLPPPPAGARRGHRCARHRGCLRSFSLFRPRVAHCANEGGVWWAMLMLKKNR